MRAAEAATRSAEATEQGQITERFTRAIDQLGATKGKDGAERNIEVRLGGIYALEQIAKDQPREFHWQVMEVLTAYVRQNTSHAPVPSPENAKGEAQTAAEEKETPVKPSEEIRAALTVIGRRNIENDAPAVEPGEDHDKIRLNLVGARLAGVDLRRAHLEGAIFSDAQIQDGNFAGSFLQWADFMDARLERAKFIGASLDGADFTRAKLEKASIKQDQAGGGRF